MKEKFRKFAHLVSLAAGTPATFLMAILIIVVWALLGPAFDYSDTWQLVINTGTTIITFLMVFLIQNSQNRDNKTLNMKIDELIRANDHARNQLIDLEELSDAELETIHNELKKLREQTDSRIQEIHEIRTQE